MVIRGLHLTDMFYMMKPIPDVSWVMRRIDAVVCPPRPETVGQALYEMAFPQPSPFPSWGDYMSHKRRNFAVTEHFWFGQMRVKRIAHRTYEVDDGYTIKTIVGQSDDQAFENLVSFLSGGVVTSATVQLVH